MNPHKYYKSAINAAAGLFGARVVGANWGPRGVGDTLARVKSRGFAPALIFDIGASNGQWTHECRRIFPKARYILVDPLQNNRDALLALARADERVSVFCGVVSANVGTIVLHDHGDQSSVLSSDDFPGVPIIVEATTVDRLFETHRHRSPILLKADVQGYELEILKGASECLASAEMLILEVSFRRIYKDSALAHEIIAYVGERGFRIYDICTYLQRSTDRDLIHSDVVFVRESSPLLSNQGWN